MQGFANSENIYLPLFAPVNSGKGSGKQKNKEKHNIFEKGVDNQVESDIIKP